MRIYPRKNIDVSNKCANCLYYKPVIKVDRTGIKTEFARGSCKITGAYKQRTETCKKIERVIR